MITHLLDRKAISPVAKLDNYLPDMTAYLIAMYRLPVLLLWACGNLIHFDSHRDLCQS